MALAALLAWVACAGCSERSQVAAASVPAADVRTVATQTRTDQVTPGRFRVTVTNAGGAPFTVDSVTLQSPGFSPVEATRRSQSFAPGQTYALPAVYGTALCGKSPVPASAVVGVRRDGGAVSGVQVDLESPDGLLERIHAQECARAALQKQVEVRLADIVEGPRSVQASLRVRRLAATGEIDVVELRGNNLFALSSSVTLPATLAPDGSLLDIPVVVAPAGCYGHLLGEIKQPYLFAAFVMIDGAAPQYVVVGTTEEQHAELQAMLRSACAGRTR